MQHIGDLNTPPTGHFIPFDTLGALIVVDAQNSPSAMCLLVVGWGWTELVLMGLLSPKLQTRLSGACLMADGALP